MGRRPSRLDWVLVRGPEAPPSASGPARRAPHEPPEQQRTDAQADQVEEDHLAVTGDERRRNDQRHDPGHHDLLPLPLGPLLRGLVNVRAHRLEGRPHGQSNGSLQVGQHHAARAAPGVAANVGALAFRSLPEHQPVRPAAVVQNQPRSKLTRCGSRLAVRLALGPVYRSAMFVPPSPLPFVRSVAMPVVNSFGDVESVTPCVRLPTTPAVRPGDERREMPG